MKKFFAIDLRSLAIMRIVIGLAVCSDVLIRIFGAQAFLFGQSLGAETLVLANVRIPWIPSLHILSSQLGYQWLLLLLQLALAVGLTLGWRTSWTSPLSWFFCLSLHFSNELVLNGGDYLLRNLLFIGIFLPWGQRFSLDKPEDHSPGVIADAASVLLFGQVCLLYWSAAMLKGEASWNQDFTALYYALNLDIFATSFGLWLLKFPSLLKGLTGLVYGLEWLAPSLLFLGKPRLRAFGLGLLILLHLSIGLTLRVGLFWLVPIAALLGLWPGEFWPNFRDTKEALELESPHSRPLQAALFLLLLSLIYLNLLTNTALEKRESMPTYRVMRTLGIHYGWGMFTQMTRQRDGWFQVVGIRSDGQSLDLETRSEPSKLEPILGSARFPNQRWRRYLLNLLEPRYQDHRQSYLRHVYGEYKAKYPEESFAEVHLVFMDQPTLPDYRDCRPRAMILERLTLSAGP